jgi:hypothetical protein
MASSARSAAIAACLLIVASTTLPQQVSATPRPLDAAALRAAEADAGGIAQVAVARRTTVVRPGGAAVRRTTVVRPAVRPVRPAAWVRPAHYWWRPGAAVAAGAAIGFVSAAAAASWAGAAPGPGYCWYYTDPSRTQGFWDKCP